MDLIITVLAIVCLTFVDPILSVQLVNMGMPEKNIGIAFGVMGAGFSFGAPTAGYLCGKITKIAVLQIGLVCVGLSELLVGPS
jgi:predicted MFS family arabinose efflux permease